MRAVFKTALALCLAMGAPRLVFQVDGSAIAQPQIPACRGAILQWHDCRGTETLRNGEKYIGEFRNGLRHGQGTYTFPNGVKYVGEFRDNKFNGHGTYTMPDGYKYVGQFVDNYFNGRGTSTTAKGETCVGEFKNDKRDGQNTCSFTDGTTYVGQFKDDQRHGQGTYSFPDGTKYVGGFASGRFHGEGTYTLPSGNVYVGQFRNSYFAGHGTLAFADGTRYVGEFDDDKRNGKGVLYSSRGEVLNSGLWVDDRFIGSDTPDKTTATPETSVQKQAATAEPSTQPATAPPPVAAIAGKRVALVIGNATYRHAPSLINPLKDANVIAATLVSVGFQTVVLKPDLTREGTIQALKEFASVADDAEWALIYYAGHGVEFGGANYIIPVDAQLKADRDIDLETVNIGQMLNAIEGAKRLRLVILDACRDNPFASQMRRTMATRSLGRGLARVEPEAGTLVVYSAKHGEVALDGSGGNSPFAEALARRIRQNPPVEIRRLFDHVRDDVLETTRRKQQPFSYGSLSASADFYFRR